MRERERERERERDVELVSGCCLLALSASTSLTGSSFGLASPFLLVWIGTCLVPTGTVWCQLLC